MINPMKKKLAIGSTVISLAVIALLVAVGASETTQKESAADKYLSRQDVCHASQRLVSEKLKAPATAKYPNCLDESAYQMTSKDDPSGSREWTVGGVVDSENGFGALLRSQWQVTYLDYAGKGGGKVDWIH
jgi:hypothetical protein